MSRCPEIDRSGALLFSYVEWPDAIELVCTCACPECRKKLEDAGYKPALRVPKGRGLIGVVELLDPRAEVWFGEMSTDDAWAMVAKCVLEGGAQTRILKPATKVLTV